MWDGGRPSPAAFPPVRLLCREKSVVRVFCDRSLGASLDPLMSEGTRSATARARLRAALDLADSRMAAGGGPDPLPGLASTPRCENPPPHSMEAGSLRYSDQKKVPRGASRFSCRVRANCASTSRLNANVAAASCFPAPTTWKEKGRRLDEHRREFDNHRRCSLCH